MNIYGLWSLEENIHAKRNPKGVFFLRCPSLPLQQGLSSEWYRVRYSSLSLLSSTLVSSTLGSHRLHSFFVKSEEMVVEGGTKRCLFFLQKLELKFSSKALKVATLQQSHQTYENICTCAKKQLKQRNVVGCLKNSEFFLSENDLKFASKQNFSHRLLSKTFCGFLSNERLVKNQLYSGSK